MKMPRDAFLNDFLWTSLQSHTYVVRTKAASLILKGEPFSP